MRELLTFLLISLSLFCKAQTFKELSTENGLSNKKVYSIQKDKIGYMWFLTHEGIDRYDGKDFVHYTLSVDGKEISSLQDLNWLYIDNDGNPWEISKKGRIFRYDHLNDSFILTYTIPNEDRTNNPTPIIYSFIDNNNCIWMCGENDLYIYDIKTKNTSRILHNLGTITKIVPYTGDHYFIGTSNGIFLTELHSNELSVLPDYDPQTIVTEINELYYDSLSDKLIIGTFYQGLYVYDLKSKSTVKLDSPYETKTTCIKPLDKNTFLIATEGAGIIKLDIISNETSPYSLLDNNEQKHFNDKVVNAIYIDEAGRVWMAIYPSGIVVQDNRYLQYKLYKHSAGNLQSLVDNGVNAILEDHDGDLWFATNNGISLYNSVTKEWKSILSSFNNNNTKNHIIYSMCETSPGIIYASGHTSMIYQINKQTMYVETFELKNNIQPDKYIKNILKDNDRIWTGGKSLKRINTENKEVERVFAINNVNSIIHKDSTSLWVGTERGLYLLNKRTNEFTMIETPVKYPYIYSLCQEKNELFIGTSGDGLLIYDLKNSSFQHFDKNNSALLSNNIYTILAENENIFLSTETGLARFLPLQNDFNNWTKEQRLTINDFNTNSGILRRNNTFIFGSCNGAIEFKTDIKLPKEYSSEMIFSDFMLFNQKTYPNQKNSPLRQNINETKQLKLKSNENTFSFKVSSINYDSPSDILYSWKLQGFYNEWSIPTGNNIIRFTNLDPGTYTLHIRSVSNENKKVIEERSLEVIVTPPLFRAGWAIFLYFLLIVLLIGFIIWLIYLRKEKNILDERFRFFINTAHDIRTPLTLIKAPLEEIKGKEKLTREGILNMSTAIRNVNVLLRMSENLVNIQRSETFSGELHLYEYELNAYMENIIKSFRAYAESKKINLTYESNFRFLTVWFDKEKIDSILQNIITNSLKYTPDHGSVSIYAYEKDNYWSIEVKDTGIGIPAEDQKKLLKENFRGSNVMDSKISGSGVGMMISGRLIKTHKGKVQFSSVENKGTTITISFPIDKKQYKKARFFNKAQPGNVTSENIPLPKENYAEELIPEKKSVNGPRILIAEDNDELRNYLVLNLSDEYTVQSCKNGKEALVIINEYKPELIVSDVIMPEMGGNELCTIIKSNIDTSHIPIILITGLNDEENILKGIKTGADDHIIKPFNIDILKASIENLLTNRALLRNKYASLDIKEEENNDLESCVNCNTNIDWEFIATMKKHVEDNMSSPLFNVDTLCSLMNMSRTSLYNKIKALTDSSPSDYIRLIKLKRAAELLKSGKYNVTEVAEMTGFNDAKYFREVFKKHFDVSPSKYKG